MPLLAKLSLGLSIKKFHFFIIDNVNKRGYGGIGRRYGLKIRWLKNREGSSPSIPINKIILVKNMSIFIIMYLMP